MFFSEETQAKIKKEFSERQGAFARLYNAERVGNPIGAVYRCISKEDPNTIVVVRYIRKDPFHYNDKKRENFNDDNFIGMSIALKKVDRLIKKIKKVPRLDMENVKMYNYEEKHYQHTDEFFDKFIKRSMNYFKKEMKVFAISVCQK